MFPWWSSYACPNLVPVHQQIWPPLTILDLFSYYISSITSEGNSSKFCIWIPLNPRCVSMKIVPLCRLIWCQTTILEIPTSIYLTLLQSYYRISSETTGQILFRSCLGCFPGGLVVHIQIWLGSVNKYGHHWLSCIFLLIASPP